MAEYLQWIGNDQPRWLQDVHPGGILELDDGSLWKPSPHSERTAGGWIRFSSIGVNCEISSTGVCCYSLINTSYGQQVNATYLGNAANEATSGVA
jgi:hypothetical protein